MNDKEDRALVLPRISKTKKGRVIDLPLLSAA
jgi:hypothetical protein